MPEFDVALWRTLPALMATHTAQVSAPSAFAAIETLMCFTRLPSVMHAAARACQGPVLLYRAYGVAVELVADPVIEALLRSHYRLLFARARAAEDGQRMAAYEMPEEWRAIALRASAQWRAAARAIGLAGCCPWCVRGPQLLSGAALLT